MGWEERKGSRYYYGKQRIGGRVRSVYLGAGDVGTVAALLQQHDAEDAAERRAVHRAQVAQIARRLGPIDEALQLLRAAIDLELLASGFHQHERAWRRRRAR